MQREVNYTHRVRNARKVTENIWTTWANVLYEQKFTRVLRSRKRGTYVEIVACCAA